jgi:solute:Na+ symporter, SSS family
MIFWFVVLYLLLSVSIGLYAATRVHTTKDFAVAGRSLPLPIVTATVFATWFGAETVFGISATFVKEGLRGVVADPFGSSFCLILAGLFFARRLYRLNLLTIGDYYRLRYNRTVEVLCTLCIVASYLGWVSAQIKALGLVFHVVSDGAVNQTLGMVMGAAIVLTYTMFGGMFAVAILDFVQITVIMGGMVYIASVISGLTGGVGAVISHAAAAGKLQFFPHAGLSAWMTMMLGSIPQQDVFQRITSARDEQTAVRGSVLGGSLYFLFAFVPMFLAYSATLVDPPFSVLLDKDPQLVLPTLILQAYADPCTNHLFRSGPLGYHELLFGDAARSFCCIQRKYHQRNGAADDRPRVSARDADRPGMLCRCRIRICHEFRGEYL